MHVADALGMKHAADTIGPEAVTQPALVAPSLGLVQAQGGSGPCPGPGFSLGWAKYGLGPVLHGTSISPSFHMDRNHCVHCLWITMRPYAVLRPQAST